MISTGYDKLVSRKCKEGPENFLTKQGALLFDQEARTEGNNHGMPRKHQIATGSNPLAIVAHSRHIRQNSRCKAQGSTQHQKGVQNSKVVKMIQALRIACQIGNESQNGHDMHDFGNPSNGLQRQRIFVNEIDEGPPMQAMLLVGSAPFRNLGRQVRMQPNRRGPGKAQPNPVPHLILFREMNVLE